MRQPLKLHTYYSGEQSTSKRTMRVELTTSSAQPPKRVTWRLYLLAVRVADFHPYQTAMIPGPGRRVEIGCHYFRPWAVCVERLAAQTQFLAVHTTLAFVDVRIQSDELAKAMGEMLRDEADEYGCDVKHGNAVG